LYHPGFLTAVSAWLKPLRSDPKLTCASQQASNLAAALPGRRPTARPSSRTWKPTPPAPPHLATGP
jgi:hypothetical protein